ncbi:hypothetical protein ACQ4M4_04055 [Leptolyngbya sp. AN02str]|uniref:hypothetical protein n=1 Tax=Leptolyngbya sp. AN02str TaxID=3423363 RepID=UPI003D3111F5
MSMLAGDEFNSLAAQLPEGVLSPEEAASRQRGLDKSWRWLLVGINLFAVVGGVAAAGFVWLMALPPAPECDRLTALSAEVERLYCAEEAARTGELPKLLASMEQLKQWTPEQPLYREAQRLMNDWSGQLLLMARQKVQASDLEGALKLVDKIPQSTPKYAEAQEAVAAWKALWAKGEGIMNAALQEMQQQNWSAAMAHVRELEYVPHDYWRFTKTVEMSRRFWHERQARKLEPEVRKAAALGKPEDLQKAIALMAQMQADTFARKELQPLVNQWSDTLLTLGLQRWKEAKVDEAIAIAKAVAANPQRKVDADHLIRLSEARKLALSTRVAWYASPQHVLSLREAIAAAKHIPEDSRVYAQAQDSIASWTQQIGDLKQLQMAQMTAALGQKEAFTLAIAQAQTIAPNRLRRAQAQTLIAHWRNELERLEDAPVLTRARRLAEPGTVAALRQGIALAQTVPMGRALRGEAQGWIYEWTNQIQTIEDEPFLRMARSLARQGKLRDAIRTASVIRPERALYQRAQAEIRGWQGQINAAARARALQEQRANAAAQPAATEPAATRPANLPAEASRPQPDPRLSNPPAPATSNPPRPSRLQVDWGTTAPTPVAPSPTEARPVPSPAIAPVGESPAMSPPSAPVAEPPAPAAPVIPAPVVVPAPSAEVAPPPAPTPAPPMIQQAPVPVEPQVRSQPAPAPVIAPVYDTEPVPVSRSPEPESAAAE